MTKGSQNFYLNQAEPLKSCLLALREIILTRDAYLSESKKYGMPCFSYVKKPLCYLWFDKKKGEPYILFVDGQLLKHPLLEGGSRLRMKILRIDPNIDIPVETIDEVLDEALFLRKYGSNSSL